MRISIALLLSSLVAIALAFIFNPVRAQSVNAKERVCKLQHALTFTKDEIKKVGLEKKWDVYRYHANALRTNKGKAPLTFVLVPCEQKDSVRVGDTVYVTTAEVIAYNPDN